MINLLRKLKINNITHIKFTEKENEIITFIEEEFEGLVFYTKYEFKDLIYYKNKEDKLILEFNINFGYLWVRFNFYETLKYKTKYDDKYVIPVLKFFIKKIIKKEINYIGTFFAKNI